MSKISDEFRHLGYSKEDEYFYLKDKELLAELRAQSDRAKKELEEEHRQREYWRRCPQCGSNLVEEDYQGIVLIDRCGSSSCGGIYFDKGELEILLKAKSGFFHRIFRNRERELPEDTSK
jgi:Zn-finger nucleic acid-binding protein